MIDGAAVHPQFIVDVVELFDSTKRVGTFEIFTCECGSAGCAGIDEGVHVDHEGRWITWRVREPLSWPVLEEPPSDRSYKTYRFARPSYQLAVREGIREIAERLRTISQELDPVLGPWSPEDLFALEGLASVERWSAEAVFQYIRRQLH